MNNRLVAGVVILLVAIVGALAIHHHHKPPPKPRPTATPVVVVPSPYPPGSCHARNVGPTALDVLPDPACTPGSTNPNVTQANIKSTICKTGWTATIRPPLAYTNQMKAASMISYGYADSISAHEEDHYIPLELGGNPTDLANLWAEPGKSVNPKDNVEYWLRQQVCAGKMTLLAAQQGIAANWVQFEGPANVVGGSASSDGEQ